MSGPNIGVVWRSFTVPGNMSLRLTGGLLVSMGEESKIGMFDNIFIDIAK